MARPRERERPVGVSDREYELIRKSHQTSHIAVGEDRRDALRRNPDLERQLLEEEIKLAKHQRQRQKSISVRLTEEELRRADKHWRRSDTLKDVANIPTRVAEIALISAAGAGTWGNMLGRSVDDRRKMASKLGDAIGDPLHYAEYLKFKKILQRVVEEETESGELSPPTKFGTGENAAPNQFADPLVRAGGKIPTHVKNKEVATLVDQILQGSENDPSHRRVLSRVVGEAELELAEFRKSPVYKLYSAIEGTVETARESTAAIKGRSITSAARLDSASKRLAAEIAAIEKPATTTEDLGSLYVNTASKSKKEIAYDLESIRSLSDIRELSRGHTLLKGKKAFTRVRGDGEPTAFALTERKHAVVSDLISVREKAIIERLTPLKGEMAGKVDIVQQGLLKARTKARGRVGMAIGGAALAVGAGMAIKNAFTKPRRDSEREEALGRIQDPSARVRESWRTRREEYGPSGISIEARMRQGTK